MEKNIKEQFAARAANIKQILFNAIATREIDTVQNIIQLLESEAGPALAKHGVTLHMKNQNGKTVRDSITELLPNTEALKNLDYALLGQKVKKAEVSGAVSLHGPWVSDGSTQTLVEPDLQEDKALPVLQKFGF